MVLKNNNISPSGETEVARLNPCAIEVLRLRSTVVGILKSTECFVLISFNPPLDVTSTLAELSLYEHLCNRGTTTIVRF
jgi:hypothetical protein